MNYSKNKMIKILSPKNKKMTIYAICIASLSGLFDLIGVSSILPLLSVLANPEILTTNETIKYFYDMGNPQMTWNWGTSYSDCSGRPKPTR